MKLPHVFYALGCIAALISAVLAVRMLFAEHPRIMALEQSLLTHWLSPAHLGEGAAAADILLCYPVGLALADDGSLYIADRGRARRGRVVWRIDPDGLATVIAGSGLRGHQISGSAREVRFERPEAVAIAHNGVYISDGFHHAVYQVDDAGRLIRIAGNGTPGYAGDGGPANEAQLFRPAAIRLDSAGNLYIADVRNHRVRKVDKSGRISTVIGTGEAGYSEDGTPATKAAIDTPWGIAIDASDRLLIAESANNIIRRVEFDGRIVTLAGTGKQGNSGDGGDARSAELNYPESLYAESDVGVYVADAWNNNVRLIGTDGVIRAVMGTGTKGRAEYGAVAAGSPIDDPSNVLPTADGLLVADGNNGRILRVTSNGKVALAAGRGQTEACNTIF